MITIEPLLPNGAVKSLARKSAKNAHLLPEPNLRDVRLRLAVIVVVGDELRYRNGQTHLAQDAQFALDLVGDDSLFAGIQFVEVPLDERPLVR
jgi:hypothetical protein